VPKADEVRKRLLHRVERQSKDFAMSSMHFLGRPLEVGTVLQIGPNKYRVPEEAYLAVIDEAPGAFWTHPVCYELHGVAKGEITVIREQYPLEAPDVHAELEPLHIPDLPHLRRDDREDPFRWPPLDLDRVELELPTVSFDLPRPCVDDRHALFVAGMDNMPHFHTDFVIMRNVLIDRYGYEPDNIIIVMGDGGGYADLPVDYAGTVADLDAALDEYAAGGMRELGIDDSLFLYTFNHGGQDSGDDVYLCMDAWTEYHDHQLKAKLDNINCARLIVAMNQCHSGGFIADVLSTTGPSEVAIMTACRHDQSAYPTSVGSHGYLSVALYTALNWAFPAAISPAFPGHVAGDIAAHDANTDGMISAQEAWQYVHDMMHAHHWATTGGIETPQWGESSAGCAASMFWGQPQLLVEDGVPVYESPDVYLHDPTVTPNDTTADTAHPANWSDYYHPDTTNRIVARVHNTGCAPARSIGVEFRVMSFGVGGRTTLVGTSPVDSIDPGHHAFAWVDWGFPSSMVHRCALARADCAADPAMPYAMANIASDDNQAQRNLDPVFSAPSTGNPKRKGRTIEREFEVRNDERREAVFAVSLGNSRGRSRNVKAEVLGADALRKIALKPGEAIQVGVRFTISAQAQTGDKLHFPIDVRRLRPDPTPMGGVTFVVEIATGRLEGRIASREGVIPTKGTVTIESIKPRGVTFRADVDRRGTFSFRNIHPGPYLIQADCDAGHASSAVFVEPNSTTTKALLLEPTTNVVGAALKGAGGKPLARALVAVRDTESGHSYLVRTDRKGICRVPDIEPGEYRVSLPEKKSTKARTVTFDYLPSGQPE